MAGRLQGKVALITGTGGGQGRASALLFAREGAKVVGCDLKVAGARDGKNGKSLRRRNGFFAAGGVERCKPGKAID